MEDFVLSPTPDSQSPTGVYIPLDIDDCCRELDKMLLPGDKDTIRQIPEEGLSQHHFGLGLWLRNNWGLWAQSSRLKQYFAKIGVQDADSMSGMIITSYWRFLNRRPLNLPGQVVYDRIARDEIQDGPKRADLN